MRGALAAAATMLLVAPAQALAITDEEIGNLSETQPSGNGTPSLSGGFDAGGGMLRGVLALIAVVVLILALARVMRTKAARRFVTPQGDGRVEIVSTTALGPGRALHLLRVGDEAILIGSSEGGIRPIRSWSGEEAAVLTQIDEAEAAPFADTLAAAVAPPKPPKRSGVMETIRQITAR